MINISNYRNISTNLSLFPSFFQNKIELFYDLSGEAPSLQLNSYIQILNLILNMTLNFEKLANPIKNMSEPEIRNLILMFLNLYFKGLATGETFNKKGKTDILIRYNNSNLFIAECKFWKGPEIMIKTIDQLFNYITWRDTKTCIIFFNKNKNISAVLSKINSTIKSHPNFIKESLELKYVFERNESIFSYEFKHPDDNERKLMLSILSCNI